MSTRRRPTRVVHTGLLARKGRKLRRLPFPTRALLVALATANFVLLAITLAGFFVSDAGYDWSIYVEAGRRAFEGKLFQWTGQYAWSYSPLLAYFFAFVAPIGFVGWSLLHLAVVMLVRPLFLAGLILFTWPFWADVYNGNTMVFVTVAAIGALSQRRACSGAYLVMCLLMPRPVMLPVMVWILWKQPAWRLRFASLVGGNVLLVIATGYALEWIEVLIGIRDAVASTSRDIGPGVILGGWWTVIGAILAVVLIVRGRLGLASLAASPYWLPQYFMMMVLDLPDARPGTAPQSSGGGQDYERSQSSPDGEGLHEGFGSS